MPPLRVLPPQAFKPPVAGSRWAPAQPAALNRPEVSRCGCYGLDPSSSTSTQDGELDTEPKDNAINNIVKYSAWIPLV